MYFRVAEKRARQKFEDRWNTCVYQGLVERSNMFPLGTPSYLWRLRRGDVQKRARRGAHHGGQWAGRAGT